MEIVDFKLQIQKSVMTEILPQEMAALLLAKLSLDGHAQVL